MADNHSNRQLIAEVISIGEEMTSGARLDTNSQWLSQRLGDLGVSVAFHTTVGDTLQDNIDVFRTACSRADVVVITGGLGPTRDDLTREALAELSGQPLELRADALQQIEELFARRKREMPERNRVQAMFPVGSQQIANLHGTAPGIDMLVPRSNRDARTSLANASGGQQRELRNRDCRIFALPGVPVEMKPMFDETVAPGIVSMTAGGNCIRHLVMKFFGTGESDMEQRLGEMISRDRDPRVGITVSGATISLRITATGSTEDVCQDKLRRTKEEILRLIPDLYFGDGEDLEQYHVVDNELRKRAQLLAVVEIGAGAPLGDWFASLGTSSSYRGGVSLTSLDVLTRVFGGTNETESLMLVKEKFGVDWLLMVDRYPTLERSSDRPMGAVDVRLWVVKPHGETRSFTFSLGGHPDILHSRIAKSAIAWLRKQLNEAATE